MPAAANAAAPLSMYLYPFPSVWAGDVGRCVTDAEAGISGQAYGAGSLADARVVARALCGVCESASAIGRGTKWSVAPEAVWKRKGRRTLERRGRETFGSLEQRKRPTVCVSRRPPGPGPGRPMTRLNRRIPVISSL